MTSRDWRIGAPDRDDNPLVMFVYLAGSGIEIYLPMAISAIVEDDESVRFVDASDQVVAVFPPRVVLIYSAEHIGEQDIGDSET
jgi:hypothetical protein